MRTRGSAVRSAAIAGAITLCAGGLQLAGTGIASATTTNDTVMVTTQKMTQPTLNSTLAGWYAKGSHLALVCYVHGQSVTGYYSPWYPGRWDDLWYKVSDNHYVADIDINTGSNTPVTAKCPAAKITLATFVSNNTGKELANVQGQYPGQCVSLVAQYLYQVYGVTVNAWGNAIDFQPGRSAGPQLTAAGWSWHTDKNFTNGDIVVWGQGAWTPAEGHIAVWYNGGIFEQNFNGRLTAKVDSFFSYGYRGYWRKI